MSTTDANFGFPDPTRHSEFYKDVTTKRLFAFLIDSFLIVMITLLVIPLTAFTALFFLGFLGFMVSFAYRVITLSSGSATLGMRLMSIEFRTHRGDRLDSGTAFMHTLFFTLSMSMVLPQLISIALMLFTARGQSLIDHVLGTAVINKAATR